MMGRTSVFNSAVALSFLGINFIKILVPVEVF